ncbi:protein kinase [Candidatus Falkowbacteria bacterium]|nr:protein kinase [Candidatus Falkowbacteria bacterium]
MKLKSFLSFFLLLSARLYKTLFYLPFYFYYRFYFRDYFNVAKLKLEDEKESNSLLFLLTEKNGSKSYLYKKQNILSVFYDMFFLNYKRIDGVELYSAVEQLKKNHILKEIFPEFILYKNKLLADFLNKNEYKRLDYFLDESIKNDDAARIREELKKIADELNNSGYIHGDIKAKNIYINKKTRKIKIIDWEGLRKISDSEKTVDKEKLEKIFENLK